MNDRTQEFIRLKDKGHTMSEIAKMFKVTKNTVIGAIWRYRQALSAPPKPPKEPKIKLPPVPKYKPGDMPKEGKTLADLLPDECRWPIGEGPFKFCGEKRESHKSYCNHHYVRSRVKCQPKKKH